MDVRINPRPLSGTVAVPPSKSMAHRLAIAAALARGVSTLQNVSLSQDLEATLRCLTALGGTWERSAPGTLRITGCGGEGPAPAEGALPRFDCGESGSTLRFFLPIALALRRGGVFTGRGRLMERPQGPYLDLFREKGIAYALADGALTVRGGLTPGEYRLPGNVSSQFFTGLLFALPLLGGPSRIVPTTAVESASYLRMTAAAMALAGFDPPAPGAGGALEIRPFAYRPFSAAVEGDWSQAAFWYAAGFLGSAVTCAGLRDDTVQGDRAVRGYADLLARPGNREIDLSDCPDLLPPLSVMAAVRAGETRFTHAQRLRLKESDRLSTAAAMLVALGAQAQVLPDGLTVRGGSPLRGGTVDGANDHRIVMAAAIAAAACTGPVTILGAEAVKKSYPSFWDDYQQLGGEVHVL